MLQITIPAVVREEFNDETSEFIYTNITKEQTLQLEHSLVSISKWESKWKKPFLSKKGMTDAEILDYIKCMTVTQNVKPETYTYLTATNIQEIVDYINEPMTASIFSNRNDKPNRERITAELIYHWMIALDIPFECRKWHLNQLMALIRVRTIKTTPAKKRSQQEIMNEYAAMNEARRKQYNTTG